MIGELSFTAIHATNLALFPYAYLSVTMELSVTDELVKYVEHQRFIVDVSCLRRLKFVSNGYNFVTVFKRYVSMACYNRFYRRLAEVSLVASVALLVSVFRKCRRGYSTKLHQLYDFCLMLRPEIEVIWHSKWTYTKVLYLFTRYIPIINIYFLLQRKWFFLEVRLHKPHATDRSADARHKREHMLLGPQRHHL